MIENVSWGKILKHNVPLLSESLPMKCPFLSQALWSCRFYPNRYMLFNDEPHVAFSAKFLTLIHFIEQSQFAEHLKQLLAVLRYTDSDQSSVGNPSCVFYKKNINFFNLWWPSSLFFFQWKCVPLWIYCLISSVDHHIFHKYCVFILNHLYIIR